MSINQNAVEKSGSRLGRLGRLGRMIGAAVVAVAIGTLVAVAPASAVGGVCDPNARLCGWQGNKGNISVTVSTDYIGNGQVHASSVRKALAPGGFSSGFTPRRDWDAVWVPGGYCLKTMGGPGQLIAGWNNRVGLSGTWHKVDDFGAYVWLKAGSCP